MGSKTCLKKEHVRSETHLANSEVNGFRRGPCGRECPCLSPRNMCEPWGEGWAQCPLHCCPVPRLISTKVQMGVGNEYQPLGSVIKLQFVRFMFSWSRFCSLLGSELRWTTCPEVVNRYRVCVLDILNNICSYRVPRVDILGCSRTHWFKHQIRKSRNKVNITQIA